MAINVPIISTFDAKGINKAIRDFKRLDSAAGKSAFAAQTMTSAANNGIRNLAKFGGIVGGIGAVIGGTLVKAALESQKVMKQTDAIVKATGGAANLTTKQIGELANAMSIKTGVDDEAIQSSMNLLLTFKAVRNEIGAGNDIFTRASMAALDLGNVFGSTDAAAKQLGKALSDPVKGVSALKKAGVDFTDAQRKQIKAFVDSGNVLGAQKLILKEVESQVGGTAAATATDFDRMKVAVGNVAEDLGTLLLPAFEAAARFVTEQLVPIFKTFSDLVGEKGLGAGFKYLAEQGLNALGKMGKFGDVVFGIGAAMVALNIATGIYTGLTTFATIVTALLGNTLTATAIAANTAFAGIPALIGFIVVIVIALMMKFKGFRDFMIGLGKVLATVFKTIANFFFDMLVNPIVKAINFLIKAFNSLPLLSDIPLLGELHIGSDKAVKDLNKIASAADFRKFEGFNAGTKKKPKPTGGGGGGTDFDKAKTALEKYTSALKLFGTETKAYKDAVKGVTTANMSLANATDDVRVAQDKFNKISKGYGAGSKEAAVATRDLADAQRSAVRATLSLRDAKRAVSDAQKEYDDLISGKGVATAKEELSIADDKVAAAQQALANAKQQYRSYDDQADATDALNDALKEQREAQKKVTEEQEKVNPQAIADAQQKISDAVLDQEDAQIALSDAQQDVIDKQKELTEVVNGAPAESEKYKDAQKELTDAQNAERDAVDALADAYDRQAEAARKLKKAKDDLAVAGKGTTTKQEQQAQKETGINPNAGGGGRGGFEFSGLPNIDFSNIDFSNIDFSGIDFSSLMPFMADGGIVNKPTLAMIGESGSEAVIPLSQLGKMGGATYNITVNAGITATPAQIGQQIIDAIKIAERRSGQVFASA